jgi:MFS family permease
LPLEIGAPPYNFSISQQGLTFIAPCIGNIFAAFCCGYLNDILGVFSARRNHGVFEPEMRLPVVAIPALLVPAGLAMFGVGVAKHAHWIVPVVGDGLVAVGLTGIASVAQPYLMDSYFPVSMDALIVSVPLCYPCCQE